jgi:hypothetical protein
VRASVLCAWRASGACLARAWLAAPARRARETYLVRRARDCCVSCTCQVRVWRMSGVSFV